MSPRSPPRSAANQTINVTPLAEDYERRDQSEKARACAHRYKNTSKGSGGRMDTWIWTEPAATARTGRGREGIWWRWCVSDRRAVGRIWSLALEKPGGGGT